VSAGDVAGQEETAKERGGRWWELLDVRFGQTIRQGKDPANGEERGGCWFGRRERLVRLR